MRLKRPRAGWGWEAVVFRIVYLEWLRSDGTNRFQAVGLAEAKTQLARFGSRWATQLPEAVTCLREGFPAATTDFAFPRAHWRRIRTTNGLERLHGEIKRRTRAVGAFPDRASGVWLITAVAVKVTVRWGRGSTWTSPCWSGPRSWPWPNAEGEERLPLLHRKGDLTGYTAFPHLHTF